MIIEPVLSMREGQEHVRRIVSSLKPIDGERFVPRAESDRLFLAHSQKSSAKTRVRLTHDGLTRRSEPDSCYVTIGVDNDERFTVLELILSMGRYPDQLTLEWDVFLEVVPELITTLRPTLVLSNGLNTDDEVEDALPEIAGLESEALPASFTPFTYLGPRRLNARLEHELSVLPSYRSSRLGEGWLVQTTEKPDHPPSRELVSSLHKLAVKCLWAK
jgi:hypothetical protein